MPLDPRRLIAFLDSRPEGLYRIKGYVDFGASDSRNRYAVHAVGRFLRFYPEPWPAAEERLTRLVLIGSGIDTANLREELGACRGDAPRTTDEHGMWGVLRYVQDVGGQGPEYPDDPDELDAAPYVHDPDGPDLDGQDLDGQDDDGHEHDGPGPDRKYPI